MTRETKIGLIVAGSFLCLVCVVVASKLNRTNEQTIEPEEQQVKVAAAKPTQNTPTPDAKKKEPTPKGAQTPAAPKEKPVTMPPMMIAPPPGTVTDPAAALQAEIERQKKAEQANGKPGAITLPPPPVEPMPLPAPGLTFPPLTPVEGGGPMVIPPPMVVPMPVEEKKTPEGDKKSVLEFPPLQPAIEQKTPDPKMPPVVAPKDDPNKLVFPPLDDPKQKKPDAAPLTPPPGIVPFNDKDPVPPLVAPKDPMPTFPSIGTPTPLEPKDPPSIQVKPLMPKNPNDTPTFPPVDTTPKPIPRIPANDVVTPPITIGPGGRPLPAVKDVNVDAYTCTAVDTNFAILSMRFYGSEKYADALLAYNRAHYKQVPNGDGFLAGTPRLAQGQLVIRPPLSALGVSNTIPSVPSTPPAVKIGAPGPLNPGVAAVSNSPTAGAGRTYRVQSPSGESILDIAERTLGNRSQWTEIYRVNQANPAVRPPALIPAGTDLKLP